MIHYTTLRDLGVLGCASIEAEIECLPQPTGLRLQNVTALRFRGLAGIEDCEHRPAWQSYLSGVARQVVEDRWGEMTAEIEACSSEPG